MILATTELIIAQALNGIPESHENGLKEYLLNDDTFEVSLFFEDHFEQAGHVFKIESLVFPSEKNESYQTILDLVLKLGNVTFEHCVFYNEKIFPNYLNKRNVGLHYQYCTFKNTCCAYDLVAHEDYSGGFFLGCVFEKEVWVSGSVRLGDLASEEDITFFHNCVFRTCLSVSHVSSNAPFMYADKSVCSLIGEFEIVELNISSSTFSGRFLLTDYKIQRLKILDCHFKMKVDAKRLEVDECVIDDSNFSAVVDFFQSHFKTFKLHKCVFSGFVGFEGCHFSDLAEFDFVTFNSFVNFRAARFDTGLAFKNTNRMELPNFFGCDFSKLAVRNTDRETFRIIKNSFDAVGNHVEGNKFYAKEMHAYERELRADGKNAEQVLLFCNKWFSNFGQSYWLPIAWLLVFSGMFALLVYGHQQDWLYQIAPDYNDTISAVSSFFNRWAAGLVVFKSLMIKGMEFLSLMFGILFSILIWLTITSIKRHTKR